MVATDSGAKSEVIAEGQTGLLTPPGDANALAEAGQDQADAAARSRIEEFAISCQWLAALAEDVQGITREDFASQRLVRAA